VTGGSNVYNSLNLHWRHVVAITVEPSRAAHGADRGLASIIPALHPRRGISILLGKDCSDGTRNTQGRIEGR
jgi:hypothetical protein